VFGYVAHGLGYAPMWGLLVALLTAGFVWSLKLPAAAAPRRMSALPPHVTPERL
jgi:hypothetical protein